MGVIVHKWRSEALATAAVHAWVERTQRVAFTNVVVGGIRCHSFECSVLEADVYQRLVDAWILAPRHVSMLDGLMLIDAVSLCAAFQ